VDFNWNRHRLYNKLACVVIYERLVAFPTARVTKTTGKPKEKWKPLPLVTVELQKVASQKLHMSSDQVMKIAEDLYNKGYISYPRTETDSFPNDFEFDPLIQQQVQDPQWGDFAGRSGHQPNVFFFFFFFFLPINYFFSFLQAAKWWLQTPTEGEKQ